MHNCLMHNAPSLCSRVLTTAPTRTLGEWSYCVYGLVSLNERSIMCSCNRSMLTSTVKIHASDAIPDLSMECPRNYVLRAEIKRLPI